MVQEYIAEIAYFNFASNKITTILEIKIIINMIILQKAVQE